MKKKGIKRMLLSFALFSLMWDVYYWLMRSTAGVLRSSDRLICLLSGFISLVVILYSVHKNTKRRNKSRSIQNPDMPPDRSQRKF